jgi:hypothetical protein
MEADISTWRKTGHFYFALTCGEAIVFVELAIVTRSGRNSMDQQSSTESCGTRQSERSYPSENVCHKSVIVPCSERVQTNQNQSRRRFRKRLTGQI